MNKPIGLFLLLAVFFGSVDRGTAAANVKPGATIFVATDGNDAWSGRHGKPNAAKTDGPLATLQRAQEKIRAMKKVGPLPAGGVTVVLRGGMYYLPRPFKLSEADSGTAKAPIVYCAAKAEKVQITGGRPITGFVPYRGSILKTDVAAQGLKGVYFRQLLFDGKRQPLARWPNFDLQNPYGGGWAYADDDGKVIPMYQDVPNESRRTFLYKKKDARNWSRPEQGEVFVFPFYNYWNNILPIATVDRQKRMITLAADATYCIRPGDRYYMRNLFEELDAPGEWYLDRKTETLYFWPPAPLEGKPVYAPTTRNLIVIDHDTSHVTIRGFVLECCEGTAVTVIAANHCLIAGNTMHHVGSGVTVWEGNCNGVVGNDICETGDSGIALSGGDRMTLTPAGNYADNNYIHHVGVFDKRGVGVHLEGVGNRVTHNLIHDCPRIGVEFYGNNLAIEYNHIRHVALETEDVGAVYAGGRDWMGVRGSRIRYNYIHDVLGYGRENGKKNGKWISPYYSCGIYLDDCASGVDVIGNIVVGATRGPMYVHNGSDNHIENNIFVGGILQQVEYAGWMGSHPFWKEHLPTLTKGYESIIGQPAWRGMRGIGISPREAVLPSGMLMAGNVLRRNILCCCNAKSNLLKFFNVSLDHNQSDYNLAYHFGRPLRIDYSLDYSWVTNREAVAKLKLGIANSVGIAKPKSQDTPANQWPKWWQSQGHDQHSVVADPLFVDPDKGDYRLRDHSPALELGFKPIPMEKIGPYADPLRASWPIVEAEGAGEKPLVSER